MIPSKSIVFVPGLLLASVMTVQGANLDPNVVNCKLTVPANPLTAAGLATPYILAAPCSMAVGTQQAFVEATIIDQDTGTLSTYHPLIVNEGQQPAAAPVVPTLAANAVVGLWFGFNGGVLQLQDANGGIVGQSAALAGANCINGNEGITGDVFGQVSWCNAQQFFTSANAAIQQGKLTIPPLGTTNAGAACPSTRSFQIVDACPNDNVVTSYLVNLNTGATAQSTAANRAALMAQGFTEINNASDEGLVAKIIDPAIGCTPFQLNSLDDPGAKGGSLASGELMAAAHQQAPISLIPLNDPDTLTTINLANTGGTNGAKTNTYRRGVNQDQINGQDSGALVPYCTNMQNVAPPFFQTNQAIFAGTTTPDAAVGNNLLTFMCHRFLMSLTQLGCPAPAGGQTVAITLDGNGAATSCTINLNGGNVAAGSSAAASASALTVSTQGALVSQAATTAATSIAGAATTASAAAATTTAQGGFRNFRGHAPIPGMMRRRRDIESIAQRRIGLRGFGETDDA